MAIPNTSTAPSYVCIECGARAQELYKDYKSGIIKISYCELCGKVVDKYVEFDPMVIMLDALLHKPQAYRHLLYNTSLASQWKLLLIFLLCDAYLKWDDRLVQRGGTAPAQDSVFYAALEWDFYSMFAVVVLEWLTFCTVTLVILSFVHSHSTDWKTSLYTLLKALTLSSFGKLLAIPAVIWGQTHSAIYLILTKVFIFTSNMAAVKVVCGEGRLKAALVMGLAHLATYWVGQQIIRHIAR